MIINFIKEEILKFRGEVRSTLGEHYEYIKELHSTMEKEVKNTSHEYRTMLAQFRIMENDFGKFTEIRELQDLVSLSIEKVKETCERFAETMKVQGDINLEVGKRLEMEKWVLRKSLDQLQNQVIIQSFSQNPIEHLTIPPDQFKPIKISTANLLSPSMSVTHQGDIQPNSMFSPMSSEPNNMA
jgi:hypothetical protein